MQVILLTVALAILLGVHAHPAHSTHRRAGVYQPYRYWFLQPRPTVKTTSKAAALPRPTSSLKVTTRVSSTTTQSLASTGPISTKTTSAIETSRQLISTLVTTQSASAASTQVTTAASTTPTSTVIPTIPAATPAPISGDCKSFVLQGVPGAFTKRSFIDFSGSKLSSQTAQSSLSNQGLAISSYPIDKDRISRKFDTKNVRLGPSSLELVVNAYKPGDSYIVGAEIETKERFQYGSIRTVQKSSSTPGVVEGNFFYRNDTQETDWEILTSTIDKSTRCVPAGIWATNQATGPSKEKTSKTIEFTFDPRTDFHEYRIDWTPNNTTFFIDGVKTTEIFTNVPSSQGPWMWNVWSNGDECWSNGPPTADSVTEIQSIEIFNGYQTDVATSGPGSCKI